MRTDKNMCPALRFPIFSANWTKKRISEIAIVTSGGTPHRTNSKYWGGNIPWVTTSLINFNTIKTAEQSITQMGLTTSAAKLFPKGTLLIAMYGQGVTRGRVAILGIEAATNQACGAIILDKQLVHIPYAFYQLQAKYESIRNIANDGGQKNLSGGLIKSLHLFISGLEEQKKIAGFLTAVDKKISQLKEKHTLLQQYKKGVMQQLFSQKVRFKDDNDKAFPDWQVSPLGQFSQKINIKNKNQTVRAVLTNSARSGIVNQCDYFNKNIANDNNLAGYTVTQNGDFVYNPRISVFAPFGPIKCNHIGQGIMSPLYTVFRFNNSEYQDFMELYFDTTQWHRYMLSIANFGARHDRMNISSSNFFSLTIPIPYKNEMDKIVGFVHALNDKIDLANTQIDQTEQFKKGLLQQMFV